MRDLDAAELSAITKRGVAARDLVWVAAASSALADGLVAYYPFDDGTAVDASGSNNDGVLVGSPPPAPALGKVGSAIDFDGNNAVEVANFSVSSAALTVALWVNADDVSALNRVFEHAWDTTGVFGAYLDSGTINTIFKSTVGGMTTQSASITAGRMYHIVMVYDGATAYLYVNAALADSSLENKTLKSASGKLYIGASPGFNFAGLVDDFRVYDWALSAAQVLELYNYRGLLDTPAAPTTGLVVHYPLDASYADVVGGYDLAPSSPAPGFVAGEIGSAIATDNSDHYAQSTAKVPASTTVSVAAWINWTSEDDVNRRYAVAQYDPAGTYNWGLSNDPGAPGGYIVWRIWNAPVNGATLASLASTTNDFNDGNWHHVVATVDKVAQTLNLYIDGELNNSASSVTALSLWAPADAYISVGLASPGGFDGPIDDVRVYDCVLSPDDVAALFQYRGNAAGRTGYGFWNDVSTYSAPVRDGRTGVTVDREFLGLADGLSVGSIPLVADITVRTVDVTLPHLDDTVQALVRGHNVRGAPIEIYRGYFDPNTRELVATAKPRFVGYIDGAPIVTPKEGDQGSVTLHCVSTTRELTRTSSDVRSHDSQLARADDDDFYKDVGVVGDWDIAWGVNRASLKNVAGSLPPGTRASTGSA